MKCSIKTTLFAICTAGSVMLLTGCDNNGVERYEISVTNITNNQPMSPPALIIHADGYTPWQVGSAASDGLEQLAESGSPSEFVAEAASNSSTLTDQAGDGLVLPGQTETYSLIVTRGDRRSSNGEGRALTLATMLVNTNDAFVGIGALDIDQLESGDELVILAHVYDAGTEQNLETAATIPGPAGGGEGFNAERELSDMVTLHSGVISASDGLTNSALDQSHRFDNPAARVVIKRL